MKAKLVFGVGFNDSPINVFTKNSEGKIVVCKYYSRWKGVLGRCYDPKYQAKYPAYKGCSVTKSWLTFSSFKKWMESQKWEGMDLDKDIIYPGNKIYSPETCCFVSPPLNKLLTDSRAKRGSYPLGVTFHKSSYQARLGIGSKKLKYLGSFNTPEEASKVYRKAKRLRILRIACCEPDIRVKQGLYRHSQLFLD